MTATESTGHERLAKVRRYRRLSIACLLVGIAGFLVTSFAGYPLVGIAIYWAGFFGMLAVWKGTSIELYDEREQELERRASDVTLGIFAFVLVLGAPGAVALEEAGVYETPAAVQGAIWAYVAVFAVFGVVYTYYRHRS